MSDREEQLARLKIIANTSSINTVIVTNDRLDMTIYAQANVPLVQIIPMEEAPKPYETGRVALWRFNIELTCYFLDDIDSEDQQETLIKELKDAIGNDPTLNETCEMVKIVNIRRGGEFPLWEVALTLEIIYEKGIANA